MQSLIVITAQIQGTEGWQMLKPGKILRSGKFKVVAFCDSGQNMKLWDRNTLQSGVSSAVAHLQLRGAPEGCNLITWGQVAEHYTGMSEWNNNTSVTNDEIFFLCSPPLPPLHMYLHAAGKFLWPLHQQGRCLAEDHPTEILTISQATEIKWV